MSPPLLLAALVAGAALATAAARFPVGRRLAARSVGRRPLETALVVVAALLGTAIITGSLIVGDTLRSSLRAGAFTHLGPVDETVTTPGADGLVRLRSALRGLEDAPAVDGLAFGLRARAAAAAGLEHDPVVAPEVLVLELDIEAARNFGGDPQATGLANARAPGPGEAAVSADLADELAVTAGDPLTLFAYGDERTFEVVDVLPRTGLAGYSTGLSARSINIFVPRGTLDEMVTTGTAARASPPVALAFVSNAGDVLSGADRTDRAVDLIRERIAPLPRADVTASKQQVLDTAEEIGTRLSEIFLAIGAFAVIAGMLLLINVFVMLAQERRGQLGIMRAVGMQRPHVVAAFAIEGGMYAAGAAVLGAAAGLGVGAVIVQVAKGIASGPAGFTLDLRFAAQPESIASGAIVGLLIALVTVVAASARVSRLNIVRAMRDLPEPPSTSSRWRLSGGWLATASGAALTGAGAPAQSGAALIVGPAALATGLGLLLAHRVGRRATVTICGSVVIAWGILAPALVAGAFRDAPATVFVIQGVVITGAAIGVLAENQRTVGQLLRRIAGGTANLPVRLGLAYPLGRPFRTTMTLAMYGLVVFTVVLVALFAKVFDSQIAAFTRAEAGGYDLLVDSAPANPLPPGSVRDSPEVEAVAPLRHARFNVEFKAEGADEFHRWFASGFDATLLQTRPPALDRWLSGIGDEPAVWRHVLQEPSAMIVGSQFLQEAGTPQPVTLGDQVVMRDPITGASRERTVVAVMEGGLAFSGAFMSEQSLSAVLGHTVPADRLYVAVDPGADPRTLASTLEDRYLRHGVHARTFRSVVAERQQSNLQFLRLLQGYLLLGLLVGIAGLAVIMLRAVRERRGQIAILRSFGTQRATIARSFMVEAGFVALQGTLIGALLATATAYQLITNAAVLGGTDVGFQFAWTEIPLLVAATVGVSVLATAGPARRASATPPAAALRTAE